MNVVNGGNTISLLELLAIPQKVDPESIEVDPAVEKSHACFQNHTNLQIELSIQKIQLLMLVVSKIGGRTLSCHCWTMFC